MAEPTGVIRPQPRNAALGALADFLQRANTAAARVQFNPQIAPQFTLADLLPLEGAAGLMQDVAHYGPRAINKGGPTLQTFRLDPRALDVAEAATYASPLTRLARPVGRMAAQQIERAMSEGRGPLGAALAPVRPMNVIKPKGGNWLAGDRSPEAAAQRLKAHDNPEQALEFAREQLAGPLPGGTYAALTERIPAWEREAALNKWLDQKLAKYVRNEMATPEDPLRALAERGVLHVDPDQLRYVEGDYAKALMPTQKVMGQSPAAKQWEGASDLVISQTRAGDLTLLSDENPWLAKVPPDTPVFGLTDDPLGMAEDLGFTHLVDELRNAVTPNSGLPRELQLKPEQLSKVTVPQAVELVDRINKWRAAQKAEADLARSTNAATAEYKAYPTIPGTDRPNERGLRWVELRTPEEAGEEAESALKTALKYEGETMGHCVGGYCPDVIEGKSRIFSLRDARGEPHVTVEVRPDRQRDKYYTDWMRQQPEAIQDEVTAAAIEYNAANPKLGYGESLNKVLRDRIGEVPDEIVQIKGKANRAPKEDYLPFVQDFVKSQQWGRVGDLRNTGLIEIDPDSDLAARIKASGNEPPKFVTQDELTSLLRQNADPAKGYAEGGAVSTDPEGEDQMGAVNRAARSLDELAERYAGGGAVRKGLKGLVEKYTKRAPQDEALETARKNAVTMLGLPENNTAMDRARAMGFEPQAGFHGTTGDIKKFDKQLLGESTGAQSAQKAFFFARDPQSPPPHMLVKAPTSSESVQMLLRLGIPEKEIAKLNEVSMKGHGAETASGYSALGGSRTYKEATRKARAAEKARNWPEYEKQTEIAEDAEISRNQELQDLVAKYGEARDVMLDRISNAILSKPLPQEEAQSLDAQMKNLMPYGWYNSYSIPQLQALKGEIEKLADPGLVNPALKSIDDFISVKANRQLAEAYQEGSNVLPAALRYKNPMVYDFGGDAYREQTYADLLDQAKQSGHDALILKNTYDPGRGPAKLIDVLAVFEPSQIRSRFAAFDPARINEADLLGFADPRLLGLTAAGTAAGLGLRPLFARDEEKQEPQKKAQGGIVRTEFEYDPAAVDARAAALMEEIDAA